MGLMDRMKAQATQLAKGAQEAGKVGQAKLEALQAKRKAEGLLTELGRITYEAQKGTGSPGDDAKRADIIGQLNQYEAEYGPIGAEHDHDAPAASADHGADAPADAAPPPAWSAGGGGQPAGAQPAGDQPWSNQSWTPPASGSPASGSSEAGSSEAGSSE
ncbi:MAG TPA: hypothetical protein VMD59_12040 [Acidimicrobiales bacterium]|nr:hypothetical protein [Acidimicrobiales bacterium]